MKSPQIQNNNSSMRISFTFIILFLLTVSSFGQLPKKAMKKMGQNPILFLDSVETDISEMQTLNPYDISNINIVKPKKAKKLLGDKGIGGAIYITTVQAAKNIYWNYFRTKSEEFKRLINSPQADTVVQYILNGKILSDSAAPGTLFLITDKNFKSLEVLDKEKILSDNVIPKRYVIAINAKRPKGLVKTKK